ncbi:MAG: PTS IIA-like nitrogen regulatory protein PtsN [Gammaproteobacteria bacterium]
MNIADLITPERVGYGIKASSRKRVLELLSNMIVNAQPQLTQKNVFESLLARERLGGTGLGRGLALPHGRLKNLDRPLGAFVQLESGVDFDANDRQPVDLLFALLVPEQSTDEHLQILATLAQMFSDKQLREQLRMAESGDALFDLLTHWQAHS